MNDLEIGINYAGKSYTQKWNDYIEWYIEVFYKLPKAKTINFIKKTDKRIKQRMVEGQLGRMLYSWFYFDLVKNVSKNKTFHSCQIPLRLVERLIKSCPQENDVVFILFDGSGSEFVKEKKKVTNLEAGLKLFDFKTQTSAHNYED